MEKFLTFIFITFLVLYLGGMLGRWFLRRWIVKKQEEFTRRFGEQGGATFRQYTWSSGSNGQQTTRKEGEIKVQTTMRQQKKASRQVGDYVEYEEVEECRTEDN